MNLMRQKMFCLLTGAVKELSTSHKYLATFYGGKHSVFCLLVIPYCERRTISTMSFSAAMSFSYSVLTAVLVYLSSYRCLFSEGMCGTIISREPLKKSQINKKFQLSKTKRILHTQMVAETTDKKGTVILNGGLRQKGQTNTFGI